MSEKIVTFFFWISLNLKSQRHLRQLSLCAIHTPIMEPQQVCSIKVVARFRPLAGGRPVGGECKPVEVTFGPGGASVELAKTPFSFDHVL